MALHIFEFDFFIKSCRHCIGILAWTWAIFVFCLSYLGRGNYNHINNNNEYGPPPLYQTVFVPILKVLLVAPSSLSVPVHLQQQQGALPWGQQIGLQLGNGAPNQGGFIYCAGCGPINPQQLVLPLPTLNSKNLPVQQNSNNGGVAQYHREKISQPYEKNSWDGAIPVQQMSISDDGRYSFSYNTADATRQEERNLDGSVTGSYSYTDPEGKLVQIDYTAGPSGYRAYGEDVPPIPRVQLPQPVQDTPEVQEARAKFLETYAREIERIRMDAATATPPSTTVSAAPVNEEVSSSEQSSTTSSSSSYDDTVEISGDDDQDQAHGHQDEEDSIIIKGKSEPSSAEHKTEPQDISALKTALDNVHQPIAIPPPTQVGGHGVEDEDSLSDSVVITAVDNSKTNVRDASVSSSLPDPAYQITIPVGLGANAGFSIQPGNLIPVQDSNLRENKPFVNQEQGHQVPVQNLNSNFGVNTAFINQEQGHQIPVQNLNSNFGVNTAFINQEQGNQIPVQNLNSNLGINKPFVNQEQGNRIPVQNPNFGVNQPFLINQEQGNRIPVQNSNFGANQPFFNQEPSAVPVQESGSSAKSNLQPYFYYVSVGGSPHFVTPMNQPGVRSPFYPTSLKASLLGAIPLAAVHDAQVPSRGGDKQQEYSTAAVRPVFLDLENTVQEQQSNSQGFNRPALAPLGAASLSLNNFNVNQLLGQIVPIGVNQQHAQGQQTSAQIGYFPAIIVNVRDDAGGASTQTKEGSQTGNVIPTIVLSNNVPQQQTAVPIQSFNQPLYVISKK